ncbi:MAG: ATP synthase F1 subunit delta [Patescibacteria group bacterium]
MKITPRKYAKALAIMLDSAEKTIISNFLSVLRQRHQMKLLPKIMEAFEEEWMKHRGITQVDVTYPENFESSMQDLDARLREKLGDKISVQAVPSDGMIGGFKVRIDDTLIDASVEGMLKMLEARLKK